MPRPHSLPAALLLGTPILLTTPAVAQPVPPDVEWFTAHNGSREESHGHFILECDDGGFLQVGETGFVGSNARILVVKTDATGSLIWKKEIGTGNRNMGNSALEVEDGYLVCGMLARNSAIIKLDKATGNTIFQRTRDNGGADAFEHLAETPNGLLAVGYRQAEDPNNTFFVYGQGYISFLDVQGNFTNGQSVNAYLSQAYRVKPAGSDFIISGGTEDALQYGVIKIDSDGTVLWNRNFGGSNEDHCFGMDLGADGSIFLAGHTLSGTANWDTYTIKLDAGGNLLWERTQGNPRGFNPSWIHDETWGIKATPDGGCIISAGTGDEYAYSECSGGVCSDQWEAYIVKFGVEGTVDWQETYRGGPGADWAAEDIDLTSDGGAIVAVDNGQFGFLKLEPFLDSETLVGDLNGDGCVTGQDLAILLADWNRADSVADLDQDGTVGGQDLAILLSLWNRCL
ncbi:MAG: hypothetical protein VX641_03525 [Planctomycetota bacterium]|nr:hypothetical protein [Planctomycetota bacterium]